MTVSRLRFYTGISLLNFGVAALMGLLLRYAAFGKIPFVYAHLLHGHSHVALLGWAWQMLFVLLAHHYLPQHNQVIHTLFVYFQCCVLGMMVSFPLQGYALFSIIFSTLHVLGAYGFVLLLWRKGLFPDRLTRDNVRLTVVLFLLASCGLWLLAFAMSRYGKESPAYLLSIQLYLHFMLHGFFVAAALALLPRYLPLNLLPAEQRLRLLLAGWVLSVGLGFALPLMGVYPGPLWHGLQLSAAILLLIVAGAGFMMLRQQLGESLRLQPVVLRRLLIFSGGCWGAKMLLQAVLISPSVATEVLALRNLYVGFIHLLMLGAVSGFLLALMYRHVFMQPGRRSASMALLWIAGGFLLTEILLFAQGLTALFDLPALPFFLYLLLAGSALMALGVWILGILWLRDYRTGITGTG